MRPNSNLTRRIPLKDVSNLTTYLQCSFMSLIERQTADFCWTATCTCVKKVKKGGKPRLKFRHHLIFLYFRNQLAKTRSKTP